jgi:hypothetical protein
MHQYFGCMAAQRLPRGTRITPVRLGWAIEEKKKQRLERLAAHAGVSSAVFLERMIDQLDMDLTDQGLPTWWPVELPRDGELPIDSA